MTPKDRHALQTIWHGMISRCTNPNAVKFKNYGGRGIRVCDRWVESFENFLADMGPRPEPSTDYSIDRIDVNGNYEPSNCRWLVKTEQARNQTKTVWITANGKTMLMADWAREMNISEAGIHSRMKRGWTPERAVTVPADKRRGRGGASTTTITAFGRMQRVSTWAKELGLGEGLIRSRLKRGWSAEQVLGPAQQQRKAA